VNNSEPLRPYAAFSPEACGEILRALQRGLDEFRRWGVPLPRGSWVEDAAKLLKRIAEQQWIPKIDQDLRRTSAAAAWAVDLYHISTCLGSESFRPVAIELSNITHGNLLASDESSTARTFLSQFWVGALLAQSKLKPELLAYDLPGKSKPDYLIQCGCVKLVVEVKRPSNWDAAIGLLDDAGGQIRDYDRPGIIIVDATDCMSSDPFQVTSNRAGMTFTVREELGRLHGKLERHIERYSRSNKFHQVAMFMTIARYWPWIRADNLERAAGYMMRASATTYRWSHQITSLMNVVQKSLLRGVEQLNGNPPKVSCD
jgi:hypothetical protein